MVAHTSIMAHQPGTDKRKRQIDRVFDVIFDSIQQGFNPIAWSISNKTGLTIGTTHARICDLKNGYVRDGVKYWCVPHSEMPFFDGQRTTVSQTWTLVTTDPVNREEQKQRIIDRIKRDAAKLREMKFAEMRELKNLFDDAE